MHLNKVFYIELAILINVYNLLAQNLLVKINLQLIILITNNKLQLYQIANGRKY